MITIRKTGTRKKIPLSIRFWNKVDKRSDSECWNWIAGKDSYGYGMIRDEAGVKRLCNRISWEMAEGDIPSGLGVLHKCDNRACVNPSHLFLGDQKVNMQDCAAKGRTVTRKGEQCSTSKISDFQARVIRRASKLVGAPWLGSLFGIGSSQVYRIRDGISRQ